MKNSEFLNMIEENEKDNFFCAVNAVLLSIVCVANMVNGINTKEDAKNAEIIASLSESYRKLCTLHILKETSKQIEYTEEEKLAYTE